MKLKNYMSYLKINNVIQYLVIIVFLVCMIIASNYGKFETVLSLAALVIGVFATPFFTKEVEVEKFREQLAYNRRYDALEKYYNLLSKFCFNSLRIKKITEDVYNKKMNYKVFLEVQKEYLSFLYNNYDELAELCQLGQIEQSIFMAPTNLTMMVGVNGFKKVIEELKNPITKEMIEEMNYHFTYISQAKAGAYNDIRKILYLSNEQDVNNISVDRYEELCSSPTPEELRNSKVKND